MCDNATSFILEIENNFLYVPKIIVNVPHILNNYKKLMGELQIFSVYRLDFESPA
jgi:hypothetical protein